ncbi:MAG: AMP-binding protein [Eudoraea sp.]|nr:AMP-binding protein [Eudoraea sp.]
MDKTYKTIHKNFKFQGSHFSPSELNDVAYSLIKEGDEEERKIGDFLMEWLSPHDSVSVKTSGSTGTPKIVKLSKQAMVNSALATGSYFGIKENDTALLCLSASHIAAKMMLVRAIVLGLSLDRIDPSTSPLSGVLKSYDLCSMVPLQLEKSLNNISKIKLLLVGGAPVSAELRAKVQKISTRIYETYGMTETCSHIAVRPLNVPISKDDKGAADSFHTLPGITVSEDDRNCLQIHAPDLEIDSLSTNDVVILVSETEFEWVGRWDNVVNSGGVKLFPEQIEKKLRPIIQGRFMLTGIPDKELGEKLVLLLEGKVDKSSLRSKIEGLTTLEKLEKPKVIYEVENFLCSESGKLLRKEIKKTLSNHSE